MSLIENLKQFEGLKLKKVKDCDNRIALFFQLSEKDPRYKTYFQTTKPIIFLSKETITEPLQLDL